MKKRKINWAEVIGFSIVGLLVLTAVYLTGLWNSLWELIGAQQHPKK